MSGGGMDAAQFERIDGFPYRKRVRDTMSAPAVTVPADATLGDAVEAMTTRAVSSVLVVEGTGRCVGIVTERDALRALRRDIPGVLATPAAAAMTSPVAGVAADDFLFRAIGRMDRLGVRHLPVLDADGLP
ncbi:MAG: CBS domain-containing protein, partial [Rhodospirillales bacterium]|nr:CBS domain-containing protein [Rhodospirillales bacterium]